MLTAPVCQRRGVTLVEVLTAIFIMAIGLMALLTLFPLGALTMRQAIQDDRAGTVARNAENLFRGYWIYAVNQRPNGKISPDSNLMAAMLNPGGGLPSRAGVAGPSYPVYVDGFGVLQYGNGATVGWRDWLASSTTVDGTAVSTLPRRTPLHAIANWPPTLQGALVINFFSSPDDTTFGENGLPSGATERQRRYSWAYLVRQPDTRRPEDVDLTVVVYANRPVGINEDLVPQGEAAYRATFNPGEMVATLVWNTGGEAPALRPGRWILDATMSPTPQGHFYRVVSISDPVDSGGTTSVTLELETPVKPGAAGANSTAVVLENVIEVFEVGLIGEGK